MQKTRLPRHQSLDALLDNLQTAVVAEVTEKDSQIHFSLSPGRVLSDKSPHLSEPWVPHLERRLVG